VGELRGCPPRGAHPCGWGGAEWEDVCDESSISGEPLPVIRLPGSVQLLSHLYTVYYNTVIAYLFRNFRSNLASGSGQYSTVLFSPLLLGSLRAR